MKTAIAFETGNIQGMAERYIAESSDYLVRRIPQRQYDPSLGEDPIKVRYSTAPIEDRPYLEMLVSGDENGSMNARSCGGDETSISTNVNSKGAFGCNIPGQSIKAGYDVFQRVLKGKAWETEPICVLDLILKAHYNEYIAMLRRDLPRRAVEQFQYSLERNVIEAAKYNTAVVPGLTFGEGAFPAIPTGTLDLGTVRRTFAILEAQGWTGPREVYTSQEAFQTMRLNYKKHTTDQIETNLGTTETHFADGLQRVTWAGITWVLSPTPVRGYLVKNELGAYELVPIRPTKARAGTGGGVVTDINEDYFNGWTYCNGQRYEVFEVAFYVHPTAASREAFAVPQVADKRFSNSMFNFEVKMIDGAYIDCNEDNLKFYFRMLHAYAFESTMPELMGAIIYRVQPDIIYIDTPTPATAPCDVSTDTITPRQPEPVEHNACSLADATDDCSDDVNAAILPVPTQDDPTPTPDEGTIRLVNCGDSTDPIITEVTAGTLTLYLERIGGVLGAASILVTDTNGTATSGDDFTANTETISWEDGEGGLKKHTIAIASDADANSVFTVVLSSPTGASLDSDANVATVKIVDPCA